MVVKVQTCWKGGDKFCFRALICGGLLLRTKDCKWDRRVASEMLDLIEIETGLPRQSIRFKHV